MTVQDLIDELKRFDPHTECRINRMVIDYVHQTNIHEPDKSIVNITHQRPMREIPTGVNQRHLVGYWK